MIHRLPILGAVTGTWHGSRGTPSGPMRSISGTVLLVRSDVSYPLWMVMLLFSVLQLLVALGCTGLPLV
jgi:hypothetical protein